MLRPGAANDDGKSLPADAFWQWLSRFTPRPAIVLMCGVAIAGVWLFMLQRVSFEREQAVEAAMRSNANLAIAFEQQIGRTFQKAEQIAAFVRDQYLTQGQRLDLPRWIAARGVNDDLFNIISVVNEDGEIVSSSSGQTGNVQYADRAFFQAQRNNLNDTLYVSEPVLGRVSGRWQVPMSLRITASDGSFAGVVVLSVDPSGFSQFYQQAGLGKRGLMELVNLDGVVFERRIGTNSGFGISVKNLDWFQRRMQTDVGDFVDDGAALDGVARIVSHRLMRDYPLVVTVGVSYDDALLPAMQRRAGHQISAIVATAALLLFSALLLWVLERQRLVTGALRSSEALFRATFNQAAMGIVHIAPNGRILRANETFCRMLGYTHDDLCRKTVFDLGEPHEQGKTRQFMEWRLSSNASIFPQEIEKTYRCSDGSVIWVCEALGVVHDARGVPELLVAVTKDITARKELEERLAHDALHDPLTRLPNRVMFDERLSRVLAAARRHETLAAVLYMDLDGFKEVNDNYGHAQGDALLRQVADRLRHLVREEDTVVRLGGDEFAIILASLSKEQDCRVVARKVLDALSCPFQLDEGVVNISVSVGAAVFPLHGVDASSLVTHADRAMYAAKGAGKNRFCSDSL